jgi:hypothetical protein
VDIKSNLTAELNVVPMDTFDDCFEQMLERCKMWVAIKGDCFEGK